MGELYGSFSDVSGEWREGLISSLSKEIVQDESPAKKWLIFDGPVDPIWFGVDFSDDTNSMKDRKHEHSIG